MIPLAIEKLTVAYRGLNALSGVSIALTESRIHGLIGPNGAGKTSLLNAVSGFVAPTAGRILLNGRALHSLPAHRIAAAGVGRTFQHAELLADQSVLANVMTGAHLHHGPALLESFLGFPSKWRAERGTRVAAEAMLDSLGLLRLKDELAVNLPFGTQKKVDLARALMTRPRVLLLDEPVSGMNDVEAHAVVQVYKRVAKERNVTILMVDHNMRVIMRLADTIHVLHHGELIAEGAPQEMQRDPRVIDAYLGTSDDRA